jgi:hypothetical protein
MTLPHPLRPTVPTPVAMPSPVDASILVPLLVLVAVLLVGWWWLRRQQPRRRSVGRVATATWQDLEAAIGAADWYERFGQRLCALQGVGGADHHGTARVLAALARDEAGQPWRAVARRWEWAIYAAHPGAPAEHRADLQLARARWP